MGPDLLHARDHLVQHALVADRGERHLHALLGSERVGAHAALGFGRGDSVGGEDAVGHAARSESTISRRAARTLGRNPPTSPMNMEKTSVVTTIRGVRWKPNASWLKDCQFIVVM